MIIINTVLNQCYIKNFKINRYIVRLIIYYSYTLKIRVEIYVKIHIVTHIQIRKLIPIIVLICLFVNILQYLRYESSCCYANIDKHANCTRWLLMFLLRYTAYIFVIRQSSFYTTLAKVKVQYKLA